MRLAGALIVAGLIAMGLAAPQGVVICHHPGPLEDPFGRGVTMIVPITALRGHLGHGDTIGPCVGPSPSPTTRPTARPTHTPSPTTRPTTSSPPPRSSSPTPSLPPHTAPPTDT